MDVLVMTCGALLCAAAYLGYRADAGLADESVMLPFGILFAAVITAALPAETKEPRSGSELFR